MTPLEALQAALAAEHAAVYGYGVAGALLRGGDRRYAARALQTHQQLRDRLVALVLGQGGSPVAALPAYRLPAPVDDPAGARDVAAHLEQGCAGRLWDLVAAAAPDSRLRALAIGWLQAAAVRAAHWGARQALPGQPA